MDVSHRRGTRSTQTALRAGAGLCLFGVCLCCAQPAPGPDAVPPAAPGSVGVSAGEPAGARARVTPGHESEAQTVAKCLTDLASPDVQVRRRAAMIIGKYPSPAALQATLACLQDPDDQVRQSALVALTEAEFMPPAAQARIVTLLADPNLAIRRIASSAVRESMRFLFLGGADGPPLLSLGPGGATAAARGPTPGVAQDPYTDAFSKALLDPDAIVRKNILSLGPMLQRRIRPDALRQNLGHEDKEIRVLALRALPTALMLPPAELLTWCKPLQKDPEPVVRQELARVLALAGPEAKVLLHELMDDADAGVCVAALEGLGRLQDESLLERAPALLREERLPLDRKQSFLYVLAGFGARSSPVLVDVAQTGPPALQAVALRLLAGAQDAKLTADFFLPFADSESRDVRTAAITSLLRFAKDLSPVQVQKLVGHKNADIRLNSLQLLWQLPPDQAAALAGDLVLDDDLDVRSSALRLIGQRCLPGWQETLRLSLDDAEPRVWRAGVDALRMVPGPESQAILTAAQQNSRNPDLKEYLLQPPGPVLLPPAGVRGPTVPLRVPGKRIPAPPR